MKALSLRQPWAWVVIHGGKIIENRVWGTSVRDRFLIHASKGMTREEYEDARAFCETVWDELGEDPNQLPAHDSTLLVRGGVCGVASIVDVVQPHTSRPSLGKKNAWHMPEQYGFVLENVRALPFVPVSGNRLWFNVDVGAHRQLMALRDAGDLA
jgi:hypothetical protein